MVWMVSMKVEPKMDTRNRWQRIYDARYNGKPLTLGEVMTTRTRISETSVDKYRRLSDQHGHTLRHPRTSVIIRMRTSDVINPKIMPRIKRHLAHDIQTIRTTRTKDGIEAQITTGDNKRLSWKTVWYANHARRK